MALPVKAQVITAARSKSPRPPRRVTWKRCCWKRSGSPAEQAPEEAPSAAGQRGREKHSWSWLTSQEVCSDHVFVLFPHSPLRAHTPLLLWRGSDGNSSQVKHTHWMHMAVCVCVYQSGCNRIYFLVRWRFPRAKRGSREPDKNEHRLDLGLVQPTRKQPTKVWNFNLYPFSPSSLERYQFPDMRRYDDW